jgi:hypothetical protein
MTFTRKNRLKSLKKKNANFANLALRMLLCHPNCGQYYPQIVDIIVYKFEHAHKLWIVLSIF